jgi:hypothetical protein
VTDCTNSVTRLDFSGRAVADGKLQVQKSPLAGLGVWQGMCRGSSIEQDAATVARLDLIAIDRQAHNNDLEAHGQPDGITVGVVAEHIAGDQTGAADDDVVFAAVELQPQTKGVEGVEPEQAALLAEVFGACPLHHIAQRAIEQSPVKHRGPAAQIEAEVFRLGAAAHALRGVAKALQVLVGVAQLGIDILRVGKELIVEHQCPPQPVHIKLTTVEKVQRVARLAIQQPVADPQIAGHGAQRDVGDGAQHPVATTLVFMEGDIPADSARGGHAVPFGREGATLGAVAYHELGIVAAKADRPFQIDGDRFTHGGATTELGHVEGG